MRMQTVRYVLLFLLMTFIIAGCSAARSDEMAGYDMAEPASAPRGDTDYVEAEEEARAVTPGELAVGNIDEVNRQKVILNSRITLEVPTPEESMQSVLDLINEHHGYVSDANQWQMGETRTRAEITARVPSEHFDAVRSTLMDMGVVTYSRMWSTDVTEEYIDLSARLENLKSEEEALRRILEAASSVEDMLAVRRHLTDIRGQIESLQGRLRYLDDRVSYSTFNIEIRPQTLPTAAISAMGFDNFGPRVTGALYRGINLVLNVTGNLLIAFVTALPALVVMTVMILLLWVVIRALRSRGKKDLD